jgi:hypothetical protein
VEECFEVAKYIQRNCIGSPRLSKEAYEQLCELDITLQSIQQNGEQDSWSYICGNGIFSSAKPYKHMMGAEGVHLAFPWLSHSICQQKHKVFSGFCSRTDSTQEDCLEASTCILIDIHVSSACYTRRIC